MKIILEIHRHSDDDPQHFVFEKFPVTLGRGFDNDVILNDPYISPRHLQIDCDGGACVVKDLDSENGFSLNGAPQSTAATLRPGDALRAGQTEIRLYTPGHAVPAALALPKDNPIFGWVARPVNVWACFIAALGVTIGWAWLEIWADEEALALTGAAAGTLSFIILWSAFWSVGGRLARRQAHFRSHAALICLYIIFGTAAWYVEAYLDFLTNGNWFSQAAIYGINFVQLGFLLYGSFALATRMPRRSRLVLSAVFSFGVMAGIFIFTLVSAKSFNQQPDYPSTLEPYLSGFAPAETVDKFMAGNDKLFASGEFTSPQ